MPASIEAWRAGFWPCPAVRIWPMITSETACRRSGALQRRLDRDLAQFMGRQVAQSAVERADRRARRGDDDDVVCHGTLLVGDREAVVGLQSFDIGLAPLQFNGRLDSAVTLVVKSRSDVALSMQHLSQNGGRVTGKPPIFEACRVLPGLVGEISRRRHDENGRTGHHQEIRQPAALQHRDQHLRDARRPGRHGQEGRRTSSSTTPSPAKTSPARS